MIRQRLGRNFSDISCFAASGLKELYHSSICRSSRPAEEARKGERDGGDEVEEGEEEVVKRGLLRWRRRVRRKTKRKKKD